MRRSLLAGLAGLTLLGVGFWALQPAPATHEGPNVLLIVWDTTRADRLGLYGYDKPTTPRLDAWAKDAVVFDRAVSPAMWTPPSHPSLFTGTAPTHHGVEATKGSRAPRGRSSTTVTTRARSSSRVPSSALA